MNYRVETWEKNDKVLCTAKPPLSSRFQETYQDTLNLVGNSHLTNYWPQGEFGSSLLCSPFSRTLAELVSQRVVTFNPFVLISFFSQDKQQLFLLSNIITLKVITGISGKPPIILFSQDELFFPEHMGGPR